MREVIITCDDCGMSEGINLATLELYQQGWVVSPSVMMNFASARHALNLFAAQPDLPIGIHLNLTEGVSIVTAPHFTRDDGRFRGRFALWRQALAPSSAFLDWTHAELTAQIERFIEFGLRPEHITTHSHFHMFPALCRIVEQLAEDYSIPWIRAHQLQATVLPFNPLERLFHKFSLEDGARLAATPLSLWRKNARGEDSNRLQPVSELNAGMHPDFLVPIKNWLTRDPDDLSHRLHTLDGVIEIVVHPCTEQDDTFPPDVRYPPRERYREMVYLKQVMTKW